MKKILTIAALVAASVSLTAPAYAQRNYGSANDAMRYDEATDPGYRSAMRGGGYRYYSNSYYDGAVIVNNQDTTCVLLVLFCKSRSSNRPQAGQTCHDANGVLFALDRNLRWYMVPGSTPVRMNTMRIVADCPWSSYTATGGQ